ncbi:hypothetical protein BDZ89DRAFT_1073746 [Hymenopellis radicata]|nr:hypothetical protein BDZ89DRAFT_1073746 [Hymenopellis radicata]
MWIPGASWVVGEVCGFGYVDNYGRQTVAYFSATRAHISSTNNSPLVPGNDCWQIYVPRG